MTKYKSVVLNSLMDLHLYDQLNEFNSRLYRQRDNPDIIPTIKPPQLQFATSTSLLSDTGTDVAGPADLPHQCPLHLHYFHYLHLLTIHGRDVKRKESKPAQTADLDSISQSTLNDFACQLFPLLTENFNTSVEMRHLPVCIKTSSAIPVLKKTSVTKT